MRLTFFSMLLFFLYATSFSQKNHKVSSPDGNISFDLFIQDSSLLYTVSFKKKTLIDPSRLSLEFGGQKNKSGYKFGKAVYRDTTESYSLLVGKSKHIQTRYKELMIPIEARGGGSKQQLCVRVFNDGLAFRYIIQGPGGDSFRLNDEITEFKLSGNPLTHTLFLPNYTSSHEGLYEMSSLKNLPENRLMAMPTLIQFPGNTFLAITEGALLDYAGMYLIKQNNIVRSSLSPLPKEPSVKVKGIYPHKSPWRVLLISDRIGSLIESDILTTLNEPNKIKDTSWIRPGKTTFPWWNGNVLPDTINAPGNNFVTQKYYIDFCARNKIEYHSVVEYGLHQWYVDDGAGFQPGPNSDVTKPVPGLDMKEVCDYATSVGVGIRVWVHWAALYPKLDTAFAVFEKWGIKGMMIDFMDRDDQEMVNMQNEMLQKAAAHKMHVQFHGAYKNTGLSRTYPNEFTREGTLNYEANKWYKAVNADHDLDIIFTRMLAGSTDYHLGGFRFVTDSLFRPQYTRPLIISTKCHMLALYVVMENYLGMVCDYPEAYEGQEGFDFIKNVPTTWDKTKVVDAQVKEYVVIARQKGEDWYVGAISNHDPRKLKFPLTFLEDGTYMAEIYVDAEDAGKNPDKVIKINQTVDASTLLTLQLAANGGAAIRFRKVP